MQARRQFFEEGVAKRDRMWNSAAGIRSGTGGTEKCDTLNVDRKAVAFFHPVRGGRSLMGRPNGYAQKRSFGHACRLGVEGL